MSAADTKSVLHAMISEEIKQAAVEPLLSECKRVYVFPNLTDGSSHPPNALLRL